MESRRVMMAPCRKTAKLATANYLVWVPTGKTEIENFARILFFQIKPCEQLIC